MKNKKHLLYLICFAFVVIFLAEIIGFQSISFGSFSVSILPLVFAVFFGMIFAVPAFRKGIFKKVYSDENVQFASKKPFIHYVAINGLLRRKCSPSNH